MGYKFLSLLTKIPISNIIIDVLHMKIRIIGDLLYHLVVDLCNLDDYAGRKGALFDRSRQHNVTRWYDFITIDCGIKRQAIAWNKDNRAGITREFNGDELVKILKRIDLPAHFPKLPNCHSKQKLWKSFYEIYSSLSTSTPALIQQHTEEWHSLFNSAACYKEKETPYIHAFGKHLHEFAATVGDVTLFTQQGYYKYLKYLNIFGHFFILSFLFYFIKGFEQSNDCMTKSLFSTTNRRLGEIIEIDEVDDNEHLSTDNYIVQLLLRFLRLEEYNTEEE